MKRQAFGVLVCAGGLLVACSSSPAAMDVQAPSSPAATTTVAAMVTTTTTVQPSTPEQEFDARAIKEGWATPGDFRSSGGEYSGPASYVKHICKEFDGPEEVSGLSHGERMEIEWKNEKPIFESGVPIFCPQHVPLLEDAVNGAVKRGYSGGSFFVPEDIKPGRYRVSGIIENCYWERTARDGSIIDNQFVTAARELEVVVSPSDGAFTTRGCGTWRMVS
ncbi:hypothetical protein [Lentzea fradiae]|uniref:hypothetical protein n=1 Tax=Lentzea fradiae TaxID=200378 RepID=UPI00115FCE84|nr:hypothetical protein [Lentzea fradiae]